MNVKELSRNQLTELKQNYYNDRHPEGVSYGELAGIDELVTDAEIFDEYAGTDFTEDDFAATAGKNLDYIDTIRDTLTRLFYDDFYDSDTAESFEVHDAWAGIMFATHDRGSAAEMLQDIAEARQNFKGNRYKAEAVEILVRELKERGELPDDLARILDTEDATAAPDPGELSPDEVADILNDIQGQVMSRRGESSRPFGPEYTESVLQMAEEINRRGIGDRITLEVLEQLTQENAHMARHAAEAFLSIDKYSEATPKG